MEAASVYIHIPFCKHLCNYCDFCKLYYKKEWAKSYLQKLEQEINSRFPKKTLKTLYIGGGTPSVLELDELEYLLSITDRFSLEDNYEFTFECNIESITEEKLKLLKSHRVNRISYGVETFHDKYLKFLNRYHTKDEVIEKIYLTKQYFDNINVDLIYALQEETIQELKEDLEQFLALGIPHISTYSLIIEPHTVLYNKKIVPIDESVDLNMYQVICQTLKQHGYKHYEVSNFAKDTYQSKHNLIYWNNEQYYGYGLGASGYENTVRYTNTRSLNRYLEGHLDQIQEKLTKQMQMEEEMFLGLRKLEGVSEEIFLEKYEVSMEKVFPIKKLVEEGKLKQEDGFIRIPEENIYLSNDVLIYFIGELDETKTI